MSILEPHFIRLETQHERSSKHAGGNSMKLHELIIVILKALGVITLIALWALIMAWGISRGIV